MVMDVKSYDERQTLALLKILALGQSDIDKALYRPSKDVLDALDNDML